MYVVRHDPRLCPSPLCGGYWVALANGARTRCADGLRRVRCYAGRAVDPSGRLLAGDVPEGSLVRGAIEEWRNQEFGRIDQLLLAALYTPAGGATASGGYFRVVDLGIRCIRAPCFSYRAIRVNGSMGTDVSSVDLGASGATPAEIARAQAAVATKNGLYARGRFAGTDDGGTMFRASRLYLTAPLPRA